jgi:hypothetical protein
VNSISPKVYLPVAIAVAASIALKLLTGDDTYLVGLLISLVAGGAGAAAPPAPGVSQADVARLAQRKRGRID